MKKKLTRLFSVLLAAVLVFGTLPVSAMGTDVADPPASAVDDTSVDVSAAEPEETTDEEPSAVDETPDGEEVSAQSAEKEAVATYASSDVQYKIVHLDCGRKYFSKDWIIALLYEMQNDGYNQLQLAFGNDGLRFLLNDMAFTANGTTYDNDTVVAKVKAGNKAQNSSGDESYLTEAEMDEIIAKADELGIEIVPLLNLPGHANAILDIANDAYNASGSNNTLNVADSAEAREFGKAIFVKYVDYFADKGCKFFNFGADEYANDASGTFSFSRLNSTQYQAFVSFINDLAGYIIGKGMTPRAFNDGLYYNGQKIDTSKYANITKIQCCYWSSGWGSYPVASASTISNNGHEMINTNGDFYYVLGKSDKFDSDYSYASDFTNSGFMDSTINNPVGSMFCIWCDYPNAETEKEVAQKTRLVLRAMAQRMDNKTVSVSDDVVANGFNADGTINVPEDPDKVVITVSGNGSKLVVDSSVEMAASKKVRWTASSDNVKITPVGDTAAYSTDVEATVVNVKALAAGEVTITATDPADESNTASVTLDVVEEDFDEEINLTVGGKDTRELTGAYDGTFLSDSIATVTGESQTLTGSYEKVTSAITTSGVYYISNQSNANRVDQNNVKVTVEYTDGNYYLKNDAGSYIYPTRNSAAVSTTPTEVKITHYGSGQFSVQNSDETYYLRYRNNALSGNTSFQTIYFYKYTGGTASTITFTGNSVGTTYVTIGDTKYKITVSPTPLTIEYWITNSPLKGDSTTGTRVDTYDDTRTINYVEVKATTDRITSEDGIAVTELVDGEAYENTTSDRHREFWQTRMLDRTQDEQTTARGDDETFSGVAFTKVRYDVATKNWQVYTDTWTNVYSNPQLVAYYMEILDIDNESGENELHANGSDWGDKGTSADEFDYSAWYRPGYGWPGLCSLSIQLVYDSGENNTNPKTTEASDLITKTYFYDLGKQGIGTLKLTGNDNYEIYRVTATTGDLQYSGGSSNSTIKDVEFVWNSDETDVWGSEDNEDAEKSVVVSNPRTKYKTNSPYDKLMWIDKNQDAVLIRVYVKRQATPDTLNVHYIEGQKGSTNEFHSLSINVKAGIVFDTTFARTGDGKLTGNTVTNASNQTETVYWELEKVPRLSAKYKNSGYQFIDAERSEEGKDVYLYYTFDNTASFVVDFGTPVTISPENIKNDLAATVTKVSVSSIEYGSVKSNDDKTFTYTPETKFAASKDGETLTVVYTLNEMDSNGKPNTLTYRVHIYHASNVLYEENFLTKADGWTDASVEHTRTQETQKAGETKNAFGYDASYAGDTDNTPITGQNGAWTIEGLTSKQLSAALTTSFYGNTFDLIGDCGPTTGRVMLVITKNGANGKHTSIVDIDTRYHDGSISQVPLAHVDMTAGTFGDDDALCTVKVYASGLEAKDVDAPRGVATMSLDGAATEIDDLLAQVLEENDLTMDDVEYTSTSVMENGALTAAASEVPGDAIATYADDTIHFAAGDHVAISGFRVYRSTTDDVAANNYPQNEKNLTYWNILDVVNGETITAYRDNNKVTNIEVANYEENGGPQNEIYLKGNSSVAVKVTNSTVDSIQVSLRAVNEAASYNNKEITTNTELYYTIEKDPNGNFVITNTGDGILAIGNVKMPSTITQADITPASEMDMDELLESVNATYSAGNEEPEVFVPETFTAKTTSTPVIRNKVVTLKVNVSSDVAYITVNGVKYTRTGLQGLFQATRTIRVVNTVPKNQTKTYEIVAYNADGVASKTVIVTG